MESIRILVKDFDTCFKFYAETLGLKITWGEPGNVYASFQHDNGIEMGIFSSDLMAGFLGNDSLDFPANCRDKIMITLNVNNVDKIYEELKTKGVKFINSPINMPDWGIRVVHLRDPEGNLIEFNSELT